MALIDDIEFYGSRVDAGDLPADQAAQLLHEASNGGLTLLGARTAIRDWHGYRERMHQLHADTVDTLRAIQGGRPVPEHVQRRQRERALESLRRALRDHTDES